MRIGILGLLTALFFACSENEEVDCELSDLKLSVSGNENADCNEGAEIELEATGGEGPYLFRFDGAPFQDLTTFQGVALGGPFLAEVTDANGCEATLDVMVTGDENTVKFEAETTTAGCGSAQGSIAITASGGDGSYNYKFEEGSFGTISSFNKLEAGNYKISVSDATGCVNVQGIRVLSGISYKSNVEAIIIGSCATTDCHVSGTGRVNFTSFNTVQSNAQSIKTRVLNKSMPKNGTLSDAEIQTIVCWVDDGALNN